MQVQKEIKIRTRYTAKSLKEKLQEYFVFCKIKNEIPTKIGMLIFLNITQNTISEWKKKQKDTFLQQLNWAYSQIQHLNLQRFLKSNPNASAWYLERAFTKEYHLSTQIDINNSDNTTPIVINLDNKGKNKIC